MLDKKELEAYVISKFKPYHCWVKFFPTNEPGWDEIGIQVSDENDKLPVFKGSKEPRAAVEDKRDEIIEMWREGAKAMGYQLDPP